MGIDQLTKVFIFSDQDTFFVESAVNDDLVVHPWRNFRDRDNVIASSAKSPNDAEVAALIGEKTHQSSLRALPGRLQDNRFFVRQRVSRVTDGRMDILTCQARVGVEQIRLGGAFAEFPENQLNGDSRAPDDGLA
jgi:hypothetical protein